MDLSPGLFRWRIERQAITVRSDSDVKSRALDGKVVMALADVTGHGLVPHCWWRFAAPMGEQTSAQAMGCSAPWNGFTRRSPLMLARGVL